VDDANDATESMDEELVNARSHRSGSKVNAPIIHYTCLRSVDL
jgi:hypothetical protein